MYNYVALILFLATPAFSQMARGFGGSRISGLHNHYAIPIDGGVVYSWDMQGPSNCNITPIPNNATFTGSAAYSLECGGALAPTLSSKGLSIADNTGVAAANAPPNFPNSWTLSTTFLPTSITGGQICGAININYPTITISQYFTAMVNSGAYQLGYDTPTAENFTTSTTPISTSVWNVTLAAYTSATPASAKIWLNKIIIPGTWTAGDGTPALPAVQVETDVGNLHTFANSLGCVGTIGYQLGWDHYINDSAKGFIYYAMYRAMQSRRVALLP